MTRSWPLLLLLVLSAALLGCVDAVLRDLDRQAAEQIRRQHRSLGDADHDPLIVPAGTRQDLVGGENAPWRKRPPTNNPPAEQLPLRPATELDALELQTTPTPAEPPDDRAATPLDLISTYQYAIGHSPEYRSQKETLFLAALSLLAEKHLWGPQFFHSVSATVTGVPEAGDHDQALDLVSELGVTQQLPYGGSLSASALVSYVNQLRSETAAPADSQETAATLSLTLPLLRDAGPVAQDSLIAAHRELTYAARDFERFRRQLFVNVATRYFNLLQTQAELRNQALQLTNLQRLAERLQALADAGRQPYFEVQQAQQQGLFARNNLLISEQAYADAVDQFKLFIGMPIAERAVIEPSQLDIPQPLLEPAVAIEAALRYRLDLQTTADRIDDTRRALAVAKNQLLPDLELTGSVSVPTDPDKTFGGLDLQPSAGSFSAGLQFDTPLNRQLEWIAYRRALIELERAHRSFTLARDNVAREVREAIRGIDQARQTRQLQQYNVQLAERRRLGVQLRERQLGPRDVIDAEEDLLQARNRLDGAERDLRVSILQFLFASGQMRVSSTGQWLAPGELMSVQDPADAGPKDHVSRESGQSPDPDSPQQEIVSDES